MRVTDYEITRLQNISFAELVTLPSLYSKNFEKRSIGIN